MFGDPTIDDFLALIDSHMAKARERAAMAVADLRCRAAAHSAINSSRTVIFTWEAVRKEFISGIETVLGELRRIIRKTKLDPGELRQHTGQRLSNFVNGMEAIARTAEARLMPNYPKDQVAAMNRHLQFVLRQFDVDFFPNEPEVPHVSNTMNIDTMINSAVQQGSPGATQSQSVVINVDEAKAAMAVIEAHYGDLNLPAEKLSDLQNDLTTIKAQLAKATPLHSIVCEGVRSIRNVVEGAIGGMLTPGIAPVINAALVALGKATGVY